MGEFTGFTAAKESFESGFVGDEYRKLTGLFCDIQLVMIPFVREEPFFK